jgi:hypothetical protein
VRKKVGDVVGNGPQLQVLGNRALADILEPAWRYEMSKIQFSRKLRTFYRAKLIDGESFWEFIDNPKPDRELEIDLRLSEADLWEDPNWRDFSWQLDGPSYADGIQYDDLGNPVSYWRANQHPGELIFNTRYTKLPAEAVVHYYDIARPGQLRGVTELAPALPLFAEHRRYVLAVIAAAETAAEHAAVLESDANAFTDTKYDPSAPETGEDGVTDVWRIPIARRAMVTLPMGWKMHQLQAEQPTDRFESFE